MVRVERAQVVGLLHQQPKRQWLLLPTAIALHFLVGLCLFSRALEGPHSLEKSAHIFRQSSKPTLETKSAEDLGLATMENGLHITPRETEKREQTKVEAAEAVEAGAEAEAETEQKAAAGCGKDTDCAGDSICVSNTCKAGSRADPRGQ
jgi:hypothetical protein